MNKPTYEELLEENEKLKREYERAKDIIWNMDKEWTREKKSIEYECNRKLRNSLMIHLECLQNISDHITEERPHMVLDRRIAHMRKQYELK